MPEPGGSPFTSRPPPTPPPKDDAGQYYAVNGQRSPSFGTVPQQASQYEAMESLSPLHQLARMSAVERSRNLKVKHMEPYLQVMAGPLLRYDTVDKQGVWRGAALVVSKLTSFNIPVVVFMIARQPPTQGLITSQPHFSPILGILHGRRSSRVVIPVPAMAEGCRLT